MKEGTTINFNAPIVNHGTINGDIINPTYNFGKVPAAERRKMALEHVDTCIREQVRLQAAHRLVLLPYVAAIRVELMAATMSHTDFNARYGTQLSQSTFSEYVPKDISHSKLTETDTAAFESELRTIMES